MSEVPLTFNNGQTATTSEISVVSEGGRTKTRNKSYLVTTLVKDGVDKNNRPLYKREIRSFDSVEGAKNFREVVDRDGLNSEAFVSGGAGITIATGSTKDGVKSFEYTNNAEDWQKTKSGEKQIKNAS